MSIIEINPEIITSSNTDTPETIEVSGFVLPIESGEANYVIYLIEAEIVLNVNIEILPSLVSKRKGQVNFSISVTQSVFYNNTPPQNITVEIQFENSSYFVFNPQFKEIYLPIKLKNEAYFNCVGDETEVNLLIDAEANFETYLEAENTIEFTATKEQLQYKTNETSYVNILLEPYRQAIFVGKSTIDNIVIDIYRESPASKTREASFPLSVTTTTDNTSKNLHLQQDLPFVINTDIERDANINCNLEEHINFNTDVIPDAFGFGYVYPSISTERTTQFTTYGSADNEVSIVVEGKGIFPIKASADITVNIATDTENVSNLHISKDILFNLQTINNTSYVLYREAELEFSIIIDSQESVRFLRKPIISLALSEEVTSHTQYSILSDILTTLTTDSSNTEYIAYILSRLLEYLPWYYKESGITNKLLLLFEKQLDNLAKLGKDVLNQLFLETADWSLDWWEEIFGLQKLDTLTDEQRRERIKAKLKGFGIINAKKLKEILIGLFEERGEFFQDHINGLIVIPKALDLEFIRQVREEIKKLIPADKKIVYAYMVWKYLDGNWTWDYLDSLQITWEEMEGFYE